MYYLAWLPDPDTERDEVDRFMRHEHVIDVFRHATKIIGHHIDWRFDGDTWYTTNDKSYRGEIGSWAIYWE